MTGQYMEMDTNLTSPRGLIFREELRAYVEDREPSTPFLMAVLRNDLRCAIGYASGKDLYLLKGLVWFLYWAVPSIAWGSEAKVNSWLAGAYPDIRKLDSEY